MEENDIMAEKKTYYLTTAIAYTSGKPHIGNTYEAVLADSIVRFKRQQGYDVRFTPCIPPLMPLKISSYIYLSSEFYLGDTILLYKTNHRKV